MPTTSSSALVDIRAIISDPLPSPPPNYVFSSPIAHSPPQPCLFKRNHSFPASIDSNRAQMLSFCLRRVYSSVIACLPPPSQFESEHSFPISTMVIQARSLVSHLHRLRLSPNARFPPPSCPFERNRSSPPLLLCPIEPERSSPTSTMSIQAQKLASRLDRVYSSSVARLPPRPSQFEHKCEDQYSLSGPTVFIRAHTQVHPP